MSENELRDFFRSLGHVEYGCSEWVLTDPKTFEIRGAGFFTDPDLLVIAVEPFVGNYNIQVCRNPRPAALATLAASRNQFNRALQRCSSLESLETLTQSALCIRSKTAQKTASLVTQIVQFLERHGIRQVSLETAGPCVTARIPFTPLALRRFGTPEEARAAFARLEEYFRESLSLEEKRELEILTWSGPDLFDPAVGIPFNGTTGIVDGARLHGPATQPDAALDALLADLLAGRPLRQSSAATASRAPSQTAGLVTDWQGKEYDDTYEQGVGILPRGAKLVLESQDSTKKREQFENIDALARDAYMLRSRNLWRIPLLSKPLSARLGGGTTAGQLVLVESESLRAAQDYLMQGIEVQARAAETLAFIVSSRTTPGETYFRAVERLAGRAYEKIEGIGQPGLSEQAIQQYRGGLKRVPVFLAVGPQLSMREIAAQVLEFRNSDDKLASLPSVLLLDGLDLIASHDGPQALRHLRHLAGEAAVTVWATAAPGSVSESAFDLVLRLHCGVADASEWVAGLAERDPDRAVSSQIVPRLCQEANAERIPAIVHGRSLVERWSQHSYHVYFPQSGRFQSIVPRREG